VLACLRDSRLPAIDQNTAQFHNRVVIDKEFDGMAFFDEGERCAAMLGDPNKKVMVMGNHGVMVIGSSVSDAFNRLFYFERSAETYIRALQTGLDLNFLSDDIAEKTARQWESYVDSADAHFNELKSILDTEEPNYRD
jgi:ribulose-5-phosphate 4-epimerase/fuculose-1-phosphate aldolase